MDVPPLPEGWIRYNDASTGLDYYNNELTGETLWERPAVAQAVAPAVADEMAVAVAVAVAHEESAATHSDSEKPEPDSGGVDFAGSSPVPADVPELAHSVAPEQDQVAVEVDTPSNSTSIVAPDEAAAAAVPVEPVTEESVSSLFDNDVGFPGAADVFTAICWTIPTDSEHDPKPHLSSAKCNFFVNSRSIRKHKHAQGHDVQLNLETFSFWEPIPFWSFPWQSWLCLKDSADQTCFLDDYGIGTVAYFKLIKSLAVVFGLMTIITLPNLLFFTYSTAVPERELLYASSKNSQFALATTSIANLGEPIPSCREVVDTENFEFSCPFGYRIQSPLALYGQPTGSCGCPYYSQVNQHSQCLGSIGKDPLSGLPACVSPNPQTPAYPCFQGLNRFGNRCCSASPYGGDDFLQLKPTPGCNSYTAPFIFYALCNDQHSCVLPAPLSLDAEIVVPVARLPRFGEDLGGGLVDSLCLKLSDDKTLCHTSLGHNFDARFCADKPYQSAASSFSASGHADEDVKRAQFRLFFEGVCVMNEVKVGDTSFSDVYIVSVSSTLNAIATIVFLLGLTWIKRSIAEEDARSETCRCTAADYTVMLSTLPKQFADEQDLKEQIAAFFAGCGGGGKGNGEAADFHRSGHHSSHVMVADVNVVTGSVPYLDACVKRGLASLKVDAVVGAIQSRKLRGLWPEEGEGGGGGGDKSLLAKLRSALLHFEAANDVCQELSSDASTTISKAFVTFANEQSVVAVLEKFPNLGSVLTPIVTPAESAPGVRLDGQAVLLERAPEPEELIYENVTVPYISTLLRVATSTFLMAVVLAISYAVIFEAKQASIAFSGDKDASPCSTYHVLVSRVPHVFLNATKGSITYLDVQRDEQPELYGLNASTDSWGSFGFLDCYCSQVLYDASQSGAKDPMAAMKAYTFYDRGTGDEQPWCLQLLSGSSSAASANYLATFVIVIANMLLSYGLNSLVEFERHATKTSQIASLVVKLFVTMYLNTAFLSLMIAGSNRLTPQILGGKPLTFFRIGDVSLGLFSGKITDYNVSWYQTTGASILFTMFTYTLGSQPALFITFGLKVLSRWWDRRFSFRAHVSRCETQHDYNNLHLGPMFDIKQKFASLLALIFVDLTYSATMPLFNLVTVLNLVAIYASDKYMLIKFLQKPPQVSAKLALKVVGLLYWAALIHSLNGAYMWGANIFYNPDLTLTIQSYLHGSLQYLWIQHSWVKSIDIGTRLTGTYSIFLFLLAIGVAIYVSLGTTRKLLYQASGLEKLVQSLAERPCCVESPVLGGLAKLLKATAEEPEGNPPYFSGIPDDAVLARLASGTLDVAVHKIYEGLAAAAIQTAADAEAGKEEEQEPGQSPSPAPAPAPGADPVAAEPDKGNLDSSNAATEPAADGVCAPVENVLNETINPLLAPASASASASASATVIAELTATATATAEPIPQQQQQQQQQQQRYLSGHESYNMCTLPAYEELLGFSSSHLNRVYADTTTTGSTADGDSCGRNVPGIAPQQILRKDFVLRGKRCVRPESDDDWLLAIIAASLPKRQLVRVKDKDGAEVDKMVIPAKALLLDALLGPLGGGPSSFNGIKGLECLAEPNERGEQAAWTWPFGGVQPSLSLSLVAQHEDEAKGGVGDGATATRVKDKDKDKDKGKAKAQDQAQDQDQDQGFDFGDVYEDKSNFSASRP